MAALPPLPFNTTLPTTKATVFVNATTKTLKIDKIFVIALVYENLAITVDVMNDSRVSPLIYRDRALTLGGELELIGPIYLNPGDKILGKSSKPSAVAISIQGDPNYGN